MVMTPPTNQNGNASTRRRKTLEEVAASEISAFRPLEAECALLGSMILDGRVIPQVMEIIGNSDTLFGPGHAAIYEALVWLSSQADTHKPGDYGVDIVKLTERLKSSNHLNDAGGVDYLVMLAESVPSAVSAPHYAKIVREARDSLVCYSHTLEAAKSILESPKDAKDIVANLEAKLMAHRETQTADAPEQAAQIASRIVEQAAAGGVGRGITTGFPDLDELTGGLYEGEMWVVGARPSMGKTAMVLRTLTEAAKSGVPSALFSIEMSKEMIALRLLSYATRISMSDIKKGNLDPQRIEDLKAASEELTKLPLYIDGTANTPNLIRARTRQMIAKHGVRLVVIDYLQLMHPDSKKEGYGTRENEVGSMSRAVKSMAKELGIAAILLSQINRAVESREGHRPRMSDLRDSGSIEQDGDVIVMLHREDYYHRDDEHYEPNHTGELSVVKQRNGPLDVVKADICPHTGQWLGTNENYVNTAFGDTSKARSRKGRYR